MPRAAKTKPKKSKRKARKPTGNPVGRPQMVTKIILQKLEQAFSLGATDLEATHYAGISERTLYNYQDRKPEFVQRKEGLKSELVLRSRKSIADGIAGDPHLALKYLERKKKGEFALRSEFTGKDGDELDMPTMIIYKPKKLDDNYDQND